MCYSCWSEAGHPATLNANVQSAAAYCSQLYDLDSVGGHAHIVSDDWNLEDEHVDFCIEACKNNTNNKTTKQRIIENEFLQIMKKLTIEERASALALFEGFISCDY